MKSFTRSIALIVAGMMMSATAFAQISITGTTYTQNFNSLGGNTITQTQIDESEKGSFEQASTLPVGWKIEANKTNPRVLGSYSSALSTTSYIGGTSLNSKAKNGTWNFGVTESEDRAVGGLTTSVDGGTRGINVMVCLYNDSPEDIKSIALSYDIKKFRNCNNTSNFVVQLYTSATGEEGSWASAGAAFRTIFTDNGNVDAVDPAENTVNVNSSFDVDFPIESELYLAWNISVASGTTCNGAPALAIDNVSLTPGANAVEPVTPIASNELFATYQKQGDRFYQTGGDEATTTESYNDWAVNYYIVSCGDSILLRATTTESNNLNNGWETQLRIWTTTKNNDNEVQVNAGDTKNRYTSKCTRIKNSVEDVKMHFFLNWGGNSVTETFNFNRASINNPIEDNVAPEIDPTDVTMTEVDGKLVFTFGDVTADDPYFYYVEDKDHHLGSISLTNNVYITKPTVEDGTTYSFKCYAVDYNGNKSAYKEFTLEMPFDPNVDLAYQKKCTAGYSNGEDTPDKAVNGGSGHWGTYGISDYSLNWWMVDLNNPYDLSEIDINFATPRKYKIEGSLDAEHWTEILRVSETPAADTKIEHTGLTASARYLKVTCLVNEMIAIRHFNVYATDIAAPDATDPTVSVSCTAKTVNTATLQIIAADKDDLNNDGIITSIIITGDNGFVDQEVVGELVENQVTLSGLKDNTTYNFTVTVRDKAGNTASTNIEVVLPFNTSLNLALGRGDYCTASVSQGGNTPEKAVNGSTSDFWTSFDQSAESYWWHIDLGIAYDVHTISIVFNDAWGLYSVYASKNNVDWTPIAVNVDADNGATVNYTELNMSAQYFKVTNTVSQIGIKEFEVYATGFSVPDATNPTVAVSEVSTTITSATLQIIAADEDDAGNPGIVSSINISGDHGFVTQNNVTLDGSNQITLSGLTDNTTYTFTVTVQDSHGNEASENIEVQLPLNPNFNLAVGKTAVAGKIQGGNIANYGCDGNVETTFSTYGTQDQTKEYWYVDLEGLYTIRQIAITWNNDYAQHFIIQGATTLPEESVRENDDAWTTYLDYTYASDPGTTRQEHAVVGKMRYLRLKSLHNEIHLGINFKELEVYGSDYATEDNVAPVIGTKECTTDSENSSATFTLTATDAVDGAIKDFYISCANPAVAEAKYSTNNDNQITITGLDNTKDYTFDIRFRDLSGNWASTSVIAHFAMAFGTNVAEGKTATAGREEGANTAANAVDGNDNTRWGNYYDGGDLTGINWWKVDLENAFKLTTIAITWQTAPVGGCVIEGSLNDVSYTEIASYNGTEYNVKVRQALEIEGEQATIPYRYIRVRANTQTNFMSFWEFEVYASEEIALLSFDDDATNNTDLIAAHHNETSNVTINRNILADDSWYTLCLPFDMSSEKVNEVFGASTIATLESSDDRGSLIHLNFNYVDAIEAGKPYLIKPGTSFTAGTTISNVTIKNVDPSAEGYKAEATHMHFQGTFDKITLTGEDKRYVSANNELYSPNPDGGSKVGAFRCYFTIPDNSSALAPGKQARIVFGPQTATGIDMINDSSKSNGKLLINGVLYIIRDGNTYNAQGMLVK